MATACVALPHATLADAERARAVWPGIDVATLEADRAAFVQRCAGCHALPLPLQHTPAEWRALVPVMGKRSKLGPEVLAPIERYLVTLAGRPPEP
jgi:hypothetical protein